jgi:hypothetical protein
MARFRSPERPRFLLAFPDVPFDKKLEIIGWKGRPKIAVKQ